MNPTANPPEIQTQSFERLAALCPECGANVPEGGTCRENFDALLLLEWQIPGGPGELAHFYAVASYGLQHPVSMNYTQAALNGLLDAVSDLLDAKVTLEEHRVRTRQRVNGAMRVTRSADSPEVMWRTGDWPMTVADVLSVEAEQEAYTERVTRWARSIRETLEADRKAGAR